VCGDEIQAKWVANQIALKRAIEKTGASKIITFHSRVNLAEDFAGDDARGFKEHVKGFDVFHVNGSQNAADRKALLESFKAAPKGLITNARCLTEGVDVPAVDMVAFVDPRKSKIDIAQAAGRAMRQSKVTNKKLGYIVVPLFIEQKKGETEAAAFTRAGFDEVAEVLGAMLESDDDLVDTIKEMQEARGRGDKFNPRQLHEKIEVIGPAINLDKLTQSIDVEILETLGASWDHWFGMLQKFHEREGHCRVIQRGKIKGLNLGGWVAGQRSRKNRLSTDQIKRLESIGFIWDVHDQLWEESFAALHEFHKREGHSQVPAKFIDDGIFLGRWVIFQRKNKDKLTSDQIKRLDSLGYSWDPLTKQWEEGFSALQKFYEREGHCRVTKEVKVNGINLGNWVNNKRSKNCKLTPDQIKRLESIGFIWDVHDQLWEENFAALQEFHKREGHCSLAPKLVIDGRKLGLWVVGQRSRKERLSPEQIKRLDSIEFIWEPFTDMWEEGFAALQKFHEREGHCRVPQGLKIDGRGLGTWVSSQRKIKNRLTTDQTKRLNSLGFIWKP